MGDKDIAFDQNFSFYFNLTECNNKFHVVHNNRSCNLIESIIYEGKFEELWENKENIKSYK